MPEPHRHPPEDPHQPAAAARKPVVQPHIPKVTTQSSLSPDAATAIGGHSIDVDLSTLFDVGSHVGVYQLLEKLGQGGMGTVFKARHTKLDKFVALKILPQSVLSQPDAVARFSREMIAVGRLSHPNVVQALDAGEYKGVHFLSMEYFEGHDLGKLVRSHNPMSVQNAVKVIRQAAMGLAAAHRLGLVHRDIKPSNLFLARQSGQIKVLDLGLALLSREERPSDLTSEGQCFGTPDYMAPEQWEDAHQCDARTDLYGLGCTLFTLLTGSPPYSGDHYRTVPKKMLGHVRDPIPDLKAARAQALQGDRAAVPRSKDKQKRASNNPSEHESPVLSDISPELDLIYQRLMAKAPDDRFGSADELIGALTSLVKSKSGQVPITDAVALNLDQSRAKLPTRRKSYSRAVLASGIVGCALLLGIIIVTITKKDGTTQTLEFQDATKVEITHRDASAKQTVASAAGSPGNADSLAGATQVVSKSGTKPPPATAPFASDQAKAHQQAWAEYLGLPVVHTNSVGMKLVLIPPGQFQMGSSDREFEEAIKTPGGDQHWRDCVTSECPGHLVVISQPFYLGTCEVTQGEYQAVMQINAAEGLTTPANLKAPSSDEASRYPASTISWNDAAEFCARLSLQEKFAATYSRVGETVTTLEGPGYRLPTEAEWEFACRAGTETRFWNGDLDEELSQVAWFGTIAADKTHPVGQLLANPFGLYDVHGNAWEYVQDCWDPEAYRQRAGKPVIDPLIAVSSNCPRVLRGGGYGFAPAGCRSAYRDAGAPSYRGPLAGFRVALTVQALAKSGQGETRSAGSTGH